MEFSNLTQVRQSINKLVNELNLDIAGLQSWRKENKNLKRLTLSKGIFSNGKQDGSQRYLYHRGGLQEVQYNIGIEEFGNKESFYYCLAFSLQPFRQELKDPEAFFKPKIERYNQYIRENPRIIEGLQMWYYDFANGNKRSDVMKAGVIPEAWIKKGNFIAIGNYIPKSLAQLNEKDMKAVSNAMNGLFPLYKYIEEESVGKNSLTHKKETYTVSTTGGFDFMSGNDGSRELKYVAEKMSPVSYSKEDVLLHNRTSDGLIKYLQAEHGKENVRRECNAPNGTRVDMAVKIKEGEYIFYEIKTFEDIRMSIRTAIGQLLEYACWPDKKWAKELVIVSSQPIDPSTAQYLSHLREQYGLPLSYKQFDLEAGMLLR